MMVYVLDGEGLYGWSCIDSRSDFGSHSELHCIGILFPTAAIPVSFSPVLSEHFILTNFPLQNLYSDTNIPANHASSDPKRCTLYAQHVSPLPDR